MEYLGSLIRWGTTPSGPKAVELTLSIPDLLVLLYPNSGVNSDTDEDAGDQRPRAILVALITLSIAEDAPKPPHIKRLTASLIGEETLSFHSKLEQNIIQYASQSVDDACQLDLEPGHSYQWEVPIEVQHDAAPYERMKHGRNFQKVSVDLEWQEEEKSSRIKSLKVEGDVCIACVPKLSNSLEYAKSIQTYADHLGLMKFDVRSHHLTVGSFLRFGLQLPSISPQCHPIVVELAIIQRTCLHSRQQEGAIFKDWTPEAVIILTISQDELHKVTSQDNLPTWVARIPSCSRIRPSTLKGSKNASIRLSHKLELRIYFKVDTDKSGTLTVYKTETPITLTSCNCRWRSLRLPEYSALDASPVPTSVPCGQATKGKISTSREVRGNIHTDQSWCTCGIPMDELLEYEEEFDKGKKTCLITPLSHQEGLLMDEEMRLNKSATTITSANGSKSERVDSDIDLSILTNDDEMRDSKGTCSILALG